MATIALDGVRKVYAGGVEAVKGISLDVPDGQMVVLVGPSGCGKSTLLRMVAGLETVTDGTIRIGDRVVNQLEPADRDIAMVFQNYALYPHMTVFNNLAYGLRNRGVAKAEIEARVRKAATMLEIDAYLDRKPRQLSGGQRQRVAMGRALVREPSAFLFDEPLSNLDAKLRVHMRVEIRNLQRATKVTSLYVTHDQVEAMTLADTLVVMNGGVAEQIGAPVDVYSKPASRFVAEFIGSPAMNMLAATAGEGGAVRLSDGRIVQVEAVPEAGRPIVLGVRPEHLAVAPEAADFTLKVEAIEVLGADTMAHGAVSGANGARQKMVVRLGGTHGVREGDVLPLKIEPSRTHLFDAATGLRI